MAVAGSTARTPEKSEAFGDAVCLPYEPPARRSRFLLVIVFVVSAWLLLAGWSDAADADLVGLDASCTVAPVAVATGESPIGLPAPPPTDPYATGIPAPAVALPPACTDPTPASPPQVTVTEVPALPPAVDPPTVPALDPSAVTADDVSVPGLPPAPPAELFDAAAVIAPPAPVDPSLPDGALLGTALDTALPLPGPAADLTPSGTQPPAGDAGVLPCSEPAPAPAALTATGGTAPGDPHVHEAAGTTASSPPPAPLVAADAGASTAVPTPDSAPAAPVSPPVPVRAPVPPPVPGPVGPTGSASVASCGTSCHGAGQTVHGDGTEAVLVAEVAASLAQAALRSTSGFAGPVVGGADDPGVRPG